MFQRKTDILLNDIPNVFDIAADILLYLGGIVLKD